MNQRMRMSSARHINGSSRSGATMVESCLVITILALLLFGGVQLSRLFAAREILDNAAMTGARSAAVGFNDFMLSKVMRVATIPNAGHRTVPGDDFHLWRIVNENDPEEGYWDAAQPDDWVHYSGNLWDSAVRKPQNFKEVWLVERRRIPLYLGAQHRGRLNGILDYADWDTLDSFVRRSDERVSLYAFQEKPIRLAFRRLWVDGDSVDMKAQAELNDHSALYLEE